MYQNGDEACITRFNYLCVFVFFFRIRCLQESWNCVRKMQSYTTLKKFSFGEHFFKGIFVAILIPAESLKQYLSDLVARYLICGGFGLKSMTFRFKKKNKAQKHHGELII